VVAIERKYAREVRVAVFAFVDHGALPVSP
jgi:hypothetical protein